MAQTGNHKGLQFGIFLAPFHRLGENPTLGMARDMELIEWIDELGYDEAWIGEHHSAGWETIASPEVFMAAAVERTRYIRLGSGVTSLPYHHPLMVANRIIQLDHHTRGRVMFGAGMIKVRGDACWHDLTCLVFHYETQPNPNPLSFWLHHQPVWFHQAGVAFNHFVELVVPWGYFAPRRVRHAAALLTILFQGLIILSGNLSFLNWLTIVPALACFDDRVTRRCVPRALRARVEARLAGRAPSRLQTGVGWAVAVLVALPMLAASGAPTVACALGLVVGGAARGLVLQPAQLQPVGLRGQQALQRRQIEHGLRDGVLGARGHFRFQACHFAIQIRSALIHRDAQRERSLGAEFVATEVQAAVEIVRDAGEADGVDVNGAAAHAGDAKDVVHTKCISSQQVALQVARVAAAGNGVDDGFEIGFVLDHARRAQRVHERAVGEAHGVDAGLL